MCCKSRLTYPRVQVWWHDHSKVDWVRAVGEVVYTRYDGGGVLVEEVRKDGESGEVRRPIDSRRFRVRWEVGWEDDLLFGGYSGERWEEREYHLP